MRLNLKLSQQGLILVGLPIGLMLIFLVSLLLFLLQVEKQANEIDRSKQIIAAANSLVKVYYDAANKLIVYKYTRADEDRQKLDSQLYTTLEGFKDLRARLKDNPDELHMLDELKAVSQHGMVLVRRYENYLGGKEDLNALEVAALYRQFMTTLGNISAKLEDLVVRETARTEETTKQQRNLGVLVKTTIISGVILAVISGAVLGILFTKNTTSRLALLMDNTVRLAKKEELLPIVSGSDEIADLDRFFHRMADVLEEAARKEREVEKLKQEFVAVISHELRTPLTSLQATLTLLLTGTYGQLTATGEKRVQSAENGISRLVMLINDLLDIEKMEAGKLTMNYAEVNLADVIERSLDGVQGFSEQQGVRIVAEKSSAKILADIDRLVQVLINLLSNAVKFTDEDGVVEVKIAEDAEYYEVQVIDHGAGIPPGDEQAIFGKYEQAKSVDGKKRKGTGLGLPICKAIVEQHGGSIGVRGTEGGGSTFWFRLPREVAAGELAQ